MALHLADHMAAALPTLRVHPTAKRIRAMVDGKVVVDSTRARIVWEPRRIVPSYAVPVADIAGMLTLSNGAPRGAAHPVTIGTGPPVFDPSTAFSVHTTPGQMFDITVGHATLRRAAFIAEDADLGADAILDFDAFDEWREEDELLVGTPATRSRRSTPGGARGA